MLAFCQRRALTNNGYDSSSGIGVRLGMEANTVSIGGLFAQDSDVKFSNTPACLRVAETSIPENYTLGATLQAVQVLLALDYQHQHSLLPPSATRATCWANRWADGPSFGWSDVNVWKLGVQWQATPKLTMRAGINVGDNPIKSADVTFNILAPGVITKHYTLGGTYALSNTSEVSFSFMYAPSNSVSGQSLAPR